MARVWRWLNRGELLWLALLTPLFYFPGDGRGLVILVIPLLWLIRKAATGRFVPVTPVNAALLLLLAMAGVGFTVSFDRGVSFPYLTRALLGIAVFFALADIDGRRGVQLSLLALVSATTAMLAFGLLDTPWPEKVPQLSPLIVRIPSVSLPLPGGADAFNPNIVGGISLFVLPLLLLLLWPRSNPLSVLVGGWARILVYLVVAGGAVLALVTLLVSQARGAYLGFVVGLLALFLLPYRWLRQAASMLAVAVGAVFYAADRAAVLGFIRSSGTVAVSSGIESLTGRMEIWSRALYALQDFPFTGVGIGLFREVVPLLYPLFTVSFPYDIGHPHNQFLAAGTDFGIPGMIAYLALWLLLGVMLWQSWHSALPTPYRRLALGLAASSIAHFTWSLTDAIVIGARGHFPFWLLLATIVTLHRYAAEATLLHDASANGQERTISEKSSDLLPSGITSSQGGG